MSRMTLCYSFGALRPISSSVKFDLAAPTTSRVRVPSSSSAHRTTTRHAPSSASKSVAELVLFAQFLDPLLLMSEVFRESRRRVSFITAAKSMKHVLIGPFTRLMHSSASASLALK